jgi:hypothetical protein
LAELSSGIDALYLSGRSELPRLLLDELSRLRAAAEAAESAVDFELLGEPFLVEPRSWGRYRYRLRHRFGLLGFTESAKLPAIRIQPRTEHLHGVGPSAVVAWWRELLEALSGHVHLTASRLDLYSDWQGWTLTVADGPLFLCRGDIRTTREHRNEFTGFEFGRRTTGTVNARIYDKTLQIREKHLDWWLDVWGDRHSAGQQVLRVEFELGRQGLREYGVDLAEEAIERAPALYAAVTERWLTHRVRTGDLTPSRWPLSDEWRTIQGAAVRGDAVGLQRIRDRKAEADLRKTMPALTGYVARFAALVGTEDIEDTLAVLPGHLRDYGIWSGKAFPERVAEKLRDSA